MCDRCGEGWHRHAARVCPRDLDAAFAWERAANPPWMRALSAACALIAVAASVAGFLGAW